MCMHNRIKEIRKALNINQIDFAKQIGLSQSTLAMIEVGKRNFSDKHIKLICSTFNISEHWIRTGEGSMFSCSPYEKELISGSVSEQKRVSAYFMIFSTGPCQAQKRKQYQKIIFLCQ